MRLTLRTLLAYMDDVLQPAQAKEIGEKIAQSDVASALQARIKDVLRRRRITTSNVDGPGSGIDPNTVADYLDYTLSPEAVAEVERVFLDSDVHLAEVAACHQIRTLILSEPVAVSVESRERMYALGPDSAKDEQLVAAMEGKRADGNGAPTPPVGKIAPPALVPSRRFEDGLPPQLRRKPLLKRLLPFLIVLLLVGAFVGVVLTDPSLFPYFGARDDDADGDGQLAGSDSSLTDAKQRGSRQPLPRPSPQGDGTIVASRGNGAKLPFPPAPAGVNRKPPPDEPEPDNGKLPAGKKPPLVDPKPPVVVAKIPADKRKDDGKQPAVAGKKQPPKPAGAAPRIQYEVSETKGLLLHFDAKFSDWLVMAPRSVVHAGDVLAAQAPFDSGLIIGDGRCRAVLQGMTRVTVLPADAVATFGFDLHRGHIVLKSAAAGNAGAGNVVLSLKIRGELFRLELLTPGTVCGVAVEPAVPTEFEKIPMKDVYSGGVYVASGAVRLSREKDAATIAAAADKSGFLSLKPSDREANAGKWNDAVRQMDRPDWLTADARTRSVAVERYSTLYLKEFEIDPAPPAKAPVPRISMLENVTAIVRDRRPLVSEFAVFAFAVTESYKELVRALADAPHEESRRAAIDGLRTWLTMSVKHGPLLKKQVRAVFTEADADIVYRVLWGYSEKDARDPATSQQLVEWLSHSHVAVRELAFLHVHRLTSRRDGYRPNLLPGQRAIAVNRWRMYVAKHGALLPKKEAEKKKADDNGTNDE